MLTKYIGLKAFDAQRTQEQTMRSLQQVSMVFVNCFCCGGRLNVMVSIEALGSVFSMPRCGQQWGTVETVNKLTAAPPTFRAGIRDLGALLRSATSAIFPPVDRIITQRELRNESTAVLREVQAGQTLIVTRNGVPVAELRPIQPRRFVPRTVVAEAAARAPHIDSCRFRADLDAVVGQSVDG